MRGRRGWKYLKALVLPSLLGMMLLQAAAAAPPAAAASVGETLLNLKLESVARATSGRYGIYLKVLQTGEEAGYRQDTAFTAASCYKLFLVMYIYERAAAGAIDLNSSLTYQAADRQEGAGAVQFLPVGTSLTVRRLCEYAIVDSDNTAAVILKRTFGYHSFRDYASSLGCPVTGGYGGDNQATARELGVILERARNLAATNPLFEEVLNLLRKNSFRSRIPAGIPAGVDVGNKTGDFEGYANDAAIVFLDSDTTYILVVLSEGAPGDGVHASISSWIYQFMYYLYGAGNSEISSGRSGETSLAL